MGMIVKRKHGYNAKRKYIQGKGFIDSLTSSLRGISSYVSQNKDLIAKPLLGAVGNLAATGLTEGTKALFNHIIKKNTQNKITPNSNTNSPPLDAKTLAILQNLMGDSNVPVSNIIGSGIKTGSGIKKF